MKQETTAPKARGIADAAKALGVSRATLYRLAAEGKIKIIKIGHRALISEAEIDRLSTQGA